MARGFGLMMLHGRWAAMLFLSSVALAQNPVPIPPMDMVGHRIETPGSGLIHSGNTFASENCVTLKVIVDARGNIESAQAIDGPREFFREAEKIEAKRQFKPFEKGGTAVRATFEDDVYIVPVEQWAQPRVPFPDVKDWKSLRMGLERGNCDGPCFLYSVEVHGDGGVEYNSGLGMLIPGHHRGHISQQAVRDLVAAFRNADYFSLKDHYIYPITDSEKVTTWIEFDGRRKSVIDYVGIWAGLPEVVKPLEKSFDDMIGTDKWVHGNGQTGPSLLAEAWDFSTDTEDNRNLFANVVAQGSAELIALCLGQPQLPKPLLSCALESAAGKGDLRLVQQLIKRGADPKDSPCSSYTKWTVLMKAAQSGNAEVVREILKYHPDVNAKDFYGRTALASFLEGSRPNTDTPKIIPLLVAAGADVDSRDTNGTMPIFAACIRGPEAVRELAQAGADLNARDQTGHTPLMSCFDNASLEAMIDAGADLTVLGPDGLTAAQEARKMGRNGKADLLESALKTHRQQ